MKKNIFRKNSFPIIVAIVFITIIVLYVIEMIKNPEYNFFNLLTLLATISGALAVWFEFRKTKKLNEAVFITNLNNDFITSDRTTYIYNVLYNARENGKYRNYVDNRSDNNLSKPYLTEEDVVKFNSYLNFFEIIYLLIQKKFVDFDYINDLFSHRFFLICNDPVVQDMKLVTQRDHYNNIYELHKLWKNYRVKRGLKIHYEETCLSKYY